MYTYPASKHTLGQRRHNVRSVGLFYHSSDNVKTMSGQRRNTTEFLLFSGRTEITGLLIAQRLEKCGG